MKALNLHFLTRIHDHETVSMMLQALSGRREPKAVSPHEAATLWSLTDRLVSCFRQEPSGSAPAADWISFLDGFFFSYTIEHIGKEFDLLKASSDGECILNIELKSEQIEEERIRKQLEQNRYYLSHTAHTIYSFTYVMETDEFYSLNSRGYFKKCSVWEAAEVLMREALQDYLTEGIDRFFRAAQYLISPVASPEQFLQEKYFLTNQQFDFRRRVLDCLQESRSTAPEGEKAPVISICGITGTGKTLLLLDLAMQLSRKQFVVFIHSGPLRKGHLVIDERLRNVSVLSGEHLPAEENFPETDYLMVDEADHMDPEIMRTLLEYAGNRRIPVIMAYDPHHLLQESAEIFSEDESSLRTTALIEEESTMTLTFSGHIRINRPVYSFLRTLLCLKDRSGDPDYSCIEVLYANDIREQEQVSLYCRKHGYERIGLPDVTGRGKYLIAQEYDRILMILDGNFYYDEALRLHAHRDEERALRMIYEGLSRTRENLCLLVTGNRELFTRVLEIKLHR